VGPGLVGRRPGAPGRRLEVVTGAGHAGLAERVLGLAQAVRPLTAVLSCRHPAGAPIGHAPSAA